MCPGFCIEGVVPMWYSEVSFGKMAGSRGAGLTSAIDSSSRGRLISPWMDLSEVMGTRRGGTTVTPSLPTLCSLGAKSRPLQSPAPTTSQTHCHQSCHLCSHEASRISVLCVSISGVFVAATESCRYTVLVCGAALPVLIVGI